MVTAVAMPLQIAQLTGSYVAVGLIGLIEVVPLIIFGLWGGAIADSFNRKRVVIASEIGLGICKLLLGAGFTLMLLMFWPATPSICV